MIELLENLEGVERVIVKNPVTFILGDNMAVLRALKEDMRRGYFHVGIVDPPYGISVGNMRLGATNASKPRNFDMGDWDNEVPTEEYWDLLKYCCRNLIVWGGNYFSHHIPAGRCFLVWDKLKREMGFADGELALTTFDKSARIIGRDRNKGGEDEAARRHPTQKPVYLYDYQHLNFVERGQRVLDTHGGSHTHAVAAGKNNVQLTIIERHKTYQDQGIEAYDNSRVKGRLEF